jgi:choline dehydrogenase-like flavoprotein
LERKTLDLSAKLGNFAIKRQATWGMSVGTNRMSENARDGVVNRNGRAHDIENLFVSDGSQFTTGAAENPTLTIVALAIRQAEHIAGELSRGNL